MNYSANKTIAILAVIMGGSSAIVFVWASLPIDASMSTWSLLADAAGAGILVAVTTLAMFWVFTRVVRGVGRYIYNRFYRTPTL